MDAKLAVSSYKAVKKKERSANNLQYSRGTLRLNLLIIALFAIFTSGPLKKTHSFQFINVYI